MSCLRRLSRRSRFVFSAALASGAMLLAAPAPVRAQLSANGVSSSIADESEGDVASGEANPLGIPDVSQFFPTATDAKGVSASIKILVLLTVLSLAPSILIMMTSFTRIMVVLALLRQAIGTQQLPPGQVLTGLSIIMTMLVMAPTWQRMKVDAFDPYLDGTMSQEVAFERGVAPLREFMLRQIKHAGNEEQVYLFVEYARGESIPAGKLLADDEVRLAELVPAFVLSELKTAFTMGFRIYLPFLVIDMVIASILISMGMMMLPPVLISLPFKLMLFVLADGWGMVVGSLLNSFQ